MTLFGMDRVFWTHQDRSPDKSRKLYPPRKGSCILFLTRSPLHAQIATDKTCLQVRGHVVVFETSLLFIQEQCVHACTCIPPKRAGGAECPTPGVRRPHPGTRQHTMYSWATLFISLPQVPQQRESKEYWSRNSLTVVTARVFYVVSGFFYFHPHVVLLWWQLVLIRNDNCGCEAVYYCALFAQLVTRGTAVDLDS